MKKYILPVVIAIACFGLHQVKADSFSFFLDAPSTAILPFPAPYISVTVDRTSTTTATISFNSVTTGGFTYLMTDGGAAAVNVNAGTWGIGSFSDTVPSTGGFTPQPVVDGGAGNEDGLGSYNQTVNGDGSASHAMTQIQFVLTNISGTWGSVGAVLALNPDFLAAAHIAVFHSNDVVNGHQITTGFVAGNGLDINPLGTVPDGGTTVMLLGAALGALGMARRYLKS